MEINDWFTIGCSAAAVLVSVVVAVTTQRNRKTDAATRQKERREDRLAAQQDQAALIGRFERERDDQREQIELLRRSVESAEREEQRATPNFDWQAEWQAGSRWVLRNHGLLPATGVRLTPNSGDDQAIRVPYQDECGEVAPSGGGITFVVGDSWGRMPITQLHVQWRENPQGQVVPLRKA